jgi:hypothetical protein
LYGLTVSWELWELCQNNETVSDLTRIIIGKKARVSPTPQLSSIRMSVMACHDLILAHKQKTPTRSRGKFAGFVIYLFGDFASLDATGADSHTFRLAINLGVDRLQIDIEAPIAEIVGFADIVTHTGFLSAYFANLSHQFLQIRVAI